MALRPWLAALLPFLGLAGLGLAGEPALPVFSFVTKAGGYFPQFNESCNRFGYNLTAVGWGQDWRGFGGRGGVAKEVAKLPPREVVIVCDSWDFVFLCPCWEMRKRFFETRGNKTVIVMLNPFLTSVDAYFYLGYAKEVAHVVGLVEETSAKYNLTSDWVAMKVAGAENLRWAWDNIHTEPTNTIAPHVVCKDNYLSGLFAASLWGCEPVVAHPNACAAHATYDMPMGPVLSSWGFHPEPLPGKPTLLEASAKVRKRWLCFYPKNDWRSPWVKRKQRPMVSAMLARLGYAMHMLYVIFAPAFSFTLERYVAAHFFTVLALLPVLKLRGYSWRWLLAALLGGLALLPAMFVGLTAGIAVYCDQTWPSFVPVGTVAAVWKHWLLTGEQLDPLAL